MSTYRGRQAVDRRRHRRILRRTARIGVRTVPEIWFRQRLRKASLQVTFDESRNHHDWAVERSMHLDLAGILIAIPRIYAPSMTAPGHSLARYPPQTEGRSTVEESPSFDARCDTVSALGGDSLCLRLIRAGHLSRSPSAQGWALTKSSRRSASVAWVK